MKRLTMLSAVVSLAATAVACSNAKTQQRCQGATPGAAADTSACPSPSSSVGIVAPTTAVPTKTTTQRAVDAVIAVRGYTESGPGTKTFTFELSAGESAVVEGYRVDDLDHGVFKVICGPGTFRSTVTDGSAVIVPSNMASAELDERLKEAVQRERARDHVIPC